MTGAIAAHYAKALADTVFAPNSGLRPQDAVVQLAAAEELVTNSKELQRILVSPAVNRPNKERVVRAIADQLELHRLLRNFLLVLVKHRRIKELRAIRSEFEQVVDERTGWIRAQIASARPLSDDEKQEVERALGTKMGKFIRAQYSVDPQLLAGIRAQVGTVVYDASLRNRFEGLRQQLGAER